MNLTDKIDDWVRARKELVKEKARVLERRRRINMELKKHDEDTLKAVLEPIAAAVLREMPGYDKAEVTTYWNCEATCEATIWFTKSYKRYKRHYHKTIRLSDADDKILAFELTDGGLMLRQVGPNTPADQGRLINIPPNASVSWFKHEVRGG
jgi:hypothetical protein